MKHLIKGITWVLFGLIATGGMAQAASDNLVIFDWAGYEDQGFMKIRDFLVNIWRNMGKLLIIRFLLMKRRLFKRFELDSARTSHIHVHSQL